MKTFRRKLKLSFLAMMCGWIACNIALWSAYGVAMLVKGEPPGTAYRMDMALIALLGTGIWILAVWLILFLPVDLLVADNSKLRRPRTAALAGLASAALFTGCYACLVIGLSDVWPADAESRLSVLMGFGTFVFGAMITGIVAAYVRALLDVPKTHAPP
jgi:small-conductance mechanosensitive channel